MLHVHHNNKESAEKRSPTEKLPPSCPENHSLIFAFSLTGDQSGLLVIYEVLEIFVLSELVILIFIHVMSKLVAAKLVMPGM